MLKVNRNATRTINSSTIMRVHTLKTKSFAFKNCINKTVAVFSCLNAVYAVDILWKNMCRHFVSSMRILAVFFRYTRYFLKIEIFKLNYKQKELSSSLLIIQFSHYHMMFPYIPFIKKSANALVLFLL